MNRSKRSFLKIAGCSVVGGLGLAWNSPLVQLEGTSTEKLPTALRAKTWGMVIDLKRCREKKGCTACIEACHKAHNVPSINNPEEEVKWVWKESYEHAFPTQAHGKQSRSLLEHPVLVLCNHCENPPCVRVCPTQATFKRESDGIVMMDQHRCIGCRYCIVACPYGARSFNWQDPREFLAGDINPSFPTRTKGVVEKCNFCAERLAEGKMPACVEACEGEGGALVFGDLEDPDSRVSRILEERYSIQRKPALGTDPRIYYVV